MKDTYERDIGTLPTRDFINQRVGPRSSTASLTESKQVELNLSILDDSELLIRLHRIHVDPQGIILQTKDVSTVKICQLSIWPDT